MDIRHCGKYGLAVSSLGLGTLTWGRDTDEEQACAMLTAFVDAGGSLVEISPLHGSGRALSVLAQALKQVGRHRIVIALRGAMRFSQGSNEISASRGDMLRCLDTTLAILDTDYVDLWLATPSSTPIPLEETLLALQWAYSSGRAHYVGLSHRDTWDCALAWAKSETLPLTAVEEEFSLVCSSPLLGRARDKNFGFLAHSPLAGGVLTGKYRHATPPDSRAASTHLRHTVAPYLDSCDPIVEALSQAAQGLESSIADIALAWVRDTPGVTSAIIGPRNLKQLEQLLGGQLELPSPIRSVLNELAAE